MGLSTAPPTPTASAPPPGYAYNSPASANGPVGAPAPAPQPIAYQPAAGISGVPQQTGAPGSGTTGPPGTPPAGTLGYESLIPYAGNAAYAGNEENTQAQSITQAGDQNINAYTAALQAGISSDPTVRTAQAAPGIQAAEAQTAAAEQNIATLPRGGAQNYLAGNAYISEASNVGDLIDQAYNSDLTALGNLGTQEAQLGLAGEQADVSAQSTAASITGGAVSGHNAQKAADESSIATDIESLAGLAIGI
jgi:hypothetical protein